MERGDELHEDLLALEEQVDTKGAKRRKRRRVNPNKSQRSERTVRASRGWRAAVLPRFPQQTSDKSDGRFRARRGLITAGSGCVRQSRKFGNWWRCYGYSGEEYCQRCSEVFRDHLLRQKSNSVSARGGWRCNSAAPQAWTVAGTVGCRYRTAT